VPPALPVSLVQLVPLESRVPLVCIYSPAVYFEI
jgi:hypothetical protein